MAVFLGVEFHPEARVMLDFRGGWNGLGLGFWGSWLSGRGQSLGESCARWMRTITELEEGEAFYDHAGDASKDGNIDPDSGHFNLLIISNVDTHSIHYI